MDSVDLLLALGVDIYHAINPVDLERIGYNAVISGDDGIYTEDAEPTRVFHGYGAAFVDDPDQVGLFSGKVGPSTYKYPPAFNAAVSNATLVGYRTILTPDKRFFTDEAYADPEVFKLQLGRLSRADPFSNEMTGLRPTDREGYFQFNSGGREERHVDDAVVVLCSDEPFSYGSFLFRVVPKVKAVRELGLTKAPCIVYAQQKPFMDLLNFCGIPKETILLHDVKVVTRVDRAIIPCLRSPHGYLDPKSVDIYAELRESHGVKTTNRKVYVSRYGLNKAGWSSRIMVNEGELIAKLEAMGFDIIEPERLSVHDQIKKFSSASIVVGPSGSGMYNTMFCQPGTKVLDIQSEPQWIYSYSGMYASLRLEYGIFIGKADPEDGKTVHCRWSVNIDALIDRIRGFIAE